MPQHAVLPSGGHAFPLDRGMGNRATISSPWNGNCISLLSHRLQWRRSDANGSLGSLRIKLTSRITDFTVLRLNFHEVE